MLEERNCLFSLSYVWLYFPGLDRFWWNNVVLFFKVLLKLFSSAEKMDNGGQGNSKGISSTFQPWNIFVVDILDSHHRSRVWTVTLWIERRQLRTLWNGAYLLYVWLTCRQFKNIFYFLEHMSWTHGFCKPLLCGCTYCYFVYWNKERSIYKIIKWSSPWSLHWILHTFVLYHITKLVLHNPQPPKLITS